MISWMSEKRAPMSGEKRDDKKQRFSRTRMKPKSQEQIEFCEKRKAKEPEQNLIFNMYA
jgi:hypothetical protein